LLDKGWYATFRRGHGEIIEHPVFAFLIEGDGRKILVDTGMSDSLLQCRKIFKGQALSK
jgi:metal-dependent hydrolase (beta-lactamase superfamily II)